MSETTERCTVCGEDPHWHDIKKHDAAVADAVVARDALVTALTAERDQAQRDARALADALRVVSWHIAELREAWERGVMREGDNLGGTRSNRNMDVAVAISRALRQGT